MRAQAAVVFAAILAGTGASADVYRVTNTRDSGTGSLRWAIERANSHGGRDKIVFAARLAGRVIRPQSGLPAITDRRTIIEGDINGDGAPDIALNGRDVPAGVGLRVHTTSYCRISGLAIASFPYGGISLYRADYNTIRSCHVGVALAGTKPAANGADGISLSLSAHNTIGGSSPAERNVISGGAGASYFGVRVYNLSHSNTITGNYIGLTRDGMTALGGGYGGVGISDCSDNTISGNVFGGLSHCVEFANGHNNLVAGNYFGLAANGDSVLPIKTGVMVSEGSTQNTIGGTTPAARNVFAGHALDGVHFTDNDTDDNRVRGNYFGLNATGTRQRRLRCGVTMRYGAGRQNIGGDSPSAGNYFTPRSPDRTCGVSVAMSGGGTVVRHNTFGILPNGTNATAMSCAVDVAGYIAVILDNTIARAERGVYAYKSGGNPAIHRNTFRACGTCVELDLGAHCRLGNLSNPSTTDDGGNRFRRSNTWYIRNLTANRVTAEGNDFGTTSRAEIDAKIWDRRDEGSFGRVDFNPLIGGVLPTGDTAALNVAAAAALPTTAGGAEICFSLSAPASVTVTILNIAGRTVAMVTQGQALDGGMARLVWSGQSAHGTRVPNGRYLARIVARDEDGQQAQVICPLRLER